MNLLYSTVDGHIGYQQLGSYPIRKNHQSGMYIKDGTTTAEDWVGLVAPEDKLSLHDPERGFIATANNKPASTLFYNGQVGYSPYTARATRLEEMISDKIRKGDKISIQYTK